MYIICRTSRCFLLEIILARSVGIKIVPLMYLWWVTYHLCILKCPSFYCTATRVRIVSCVYSNATIKFHAFRTETDRLIFTRHTLRVYQPALGYRCRWLVDIMAGGDGLVIYAALLGQVLWLRGCHVDPEKKSIKKWMPLNIICKFNYLLMLQMQKLFQSYYTGHFHLNIYFIKVKRT